ncbi:uncharacterized protein EI90DRAFT_2415993 [Cantharellus anzutake]|uniref:uncharacterized protein n=1 Tax=Cantharellus anzutake TaxID=1750568 RepID=UPI001902DF9B|nr:uncharacterized protein EI90DRAFT_2415993 [Cantharellus anzutake]KAF8338799.1 hypothetical protein EI90DRAFT_2415993 [Cantharellus anzutake]
MFKMFSRHNRGTRPAPGLSSQPSHPQAPSESHVPQLHITGPQISPDHDKTHRDQPGVPAGSFPSPAVAAQTLLSGDRNDPMKSTSFMGRISSEISGIFGRNRSKPGTPKQSRPTTPTPQPYANNAAPPPSPLTPTGNVDDPSGSSGMHATPDSGSKIRAQLEREGINVPSLSELTPSATSKSDRKKVVINAIRLVLENAADALKFVPIPNPDAIPNLLLKWLQVYDVSLSFHFCDR